MDEIDRILSNEPPLRPSAGFRDRVMNAVREQAATPEPIAFPWRRFLPGALAGALLLIVAVGAAISGVTVEPASAEAGFALGDLQTPLLRDLAIAAAALLGCALVAGMAIRTTASSTPRF